MVHHSHPDKHKHKHSSFLDTINPVNAGKHLFHELEESPLNPVYEGKKLGKWTKEKEDEVHNISKSIELFIVAVLGFFLYWSFKKT